MYRPEIIPLTLILLVVALSGCTSNNGNLTSVNNTSLALESSAFTENGMIPAKYTASGGNISPPLSWKSAPANTKSYAIICQDPDAKGGNFTHWIIFNIPANTTQLKEGIPPKEALENGAKQGKNDFGKIGYSGPNPPSGVHRYVFTIYALDTLLNLNGEISKDDFLKASHKHILSQGQLTGQYGK